jgi:C_GCAxxG_C_C family probable redox protein
MTDPAAANESGPTGHADRDAEGDLAVGAVMNARVAFLDGGHGCAEATFVALKTAFGLPDPGDSAPAIALNGGIAWTGGPCGAITGAAMAIGMLGASRITDRARAKRVARELVAGLMAEFQARHGALTCRELTGLDLRAPGAHHAFLDAGTWRTSCMDQIEFVVRRAARLSDPVTWAAATAAVEAASLGSAGPDHDGVADR